MIEGTDTVTINGVEFTTYEGVNGAKCHLVHTKEEWKAFYSLLMKQKKVAFDTETTGFEYYLDKHIVGFSFGWGLENFYIATRHEDSALDGKQVEQVPFEYLVDDLREFFSQTDVTTIYFNAKFDQHFILKEGIEDHTRYRDASLFWMLFDENSPGKLKTISTGWKDMLGEYHKGVVHKDAAAKEKLLDDWRSSESRYRRKLYSEAVKAKINEYQEQVKYQGVKVLELRKLAKLELKDHPYVDSSKKSVHYGFIPIPMMAEYAGLDTYLTWEVYHFCIDNIKWTKQLVDLVEHEHKLTKTLLDIEETGCLLDRDYLIEAGKTLESEITEAKLKVSDFFGVDNPNSSAQLVTALLSKNIKLTEKTNSASKCIGCAKGTCIKHFKVDVKVLNKLAKSMPEVQLILDYRMKTKIKGTYVDSIIDKLTSDNILHCSYRQNVSTGRMAASDPNLQNIPRRDTTIRTAFIVPDDYIFVFADYSQIEVRLTAHFSKDPALLEAYHHGQDIHLKTMCAMFRYEYDYASNIYHTYPESDPLYKKIKELRSIAKVLNFGVIYGVSPSGLSEQVPRPAAMRDYSQKKWINECASFIDAYLYGYLGVKRMINKYSRLARKQGYIENGFGRVRHLPHARACAITGDPDLKYLEARAGRQAVNYLIQGTAADLFKVAVVRVDQILRGTKSKIVNLVHDEIQIYLHKSELHLLKQVKEAMEDFQYEVPILADFEYSTTNWARKETIK